MALLVDCARLVDARVQIVLVAVEVACERMGSSMRSDGNVAMIWWRSLSLKSMHTLI